MSNSIEHFVEPSRVSRFVTTKRQVSWRSAAEADVSRLHKEDPRIAKLALQRAKALEAGTESGQPLEDSMQTGDLSDCFKVYFGVGSPPSHRLVYHQISEASAVAFEIIEVVAVEGRDSGYVYLLASSRLKRLPAETRQFFNRIHQDVIARRGRSRD